MFVCRLVSCVPCGLHGGRWSCSTYRLTTAHHRPLMQLRPLGQARHTGQAVIRAAPPCLTAGTRPLSWPVRFPAACRGVCRTRRILSLLFPCLYIFIVCTYLSLPVYPRALSSSISWRGVNGARVGFVLPDTPLCWLRLYCTWHSLQYGCKPSLHVLFL